MKLANFFLMTVLVGTLGVLGCGDDPATGNGGDGGSGGSIDPNELCDVEICAEDSDVGRLAKAACVDEIESCLTTGEFTEEQCIGFGVETCSGDAG